VSAERHDYRLLTLALIIFLLSGTAIGLSQTPPGPNTVQHGEGINLPTITATDGYFYGATNVTDQIFGDFTGLPLTGTTLDTGQGAYELYAMDQNVLISSDVNFSSLEADEFFLDSVNKTDEIDSLNQRLGTTDSPTFTNLTLNGPVNGVTLEDGYVYTYGQVYGVEWNQGTDTWRQIDWSSSTITPTTADFNGHPIWGGITRVNLAASGTINARLGDGDYASDGSNGEVMVEIPAFYVKAEQPNSGVYRWWISATPLTGFEIHPAFLQRDGRPQAYIYIGAYEASLMVGTGVHDTDTTLKLHTRSAEQPWTSGEIDALPYDTGSTEFTRGETLTGAISGATGDVIDWTVTGGDWGTNDAAGTVYIKQQAVANFQAENIAGDVSGVAAATGVQVAEALTISDARTYAGNQGAGWGEMGIWSLSAVKLLFIVEYGNMDSQTEVGRGVVDLAAGVGYAGLETAAAGVDGNLDAAGTGVGTGADGDVPATYRYMENLWGNVWMFIDGYNAVDAEYRLIERNGDGTFADALATYEASSMAPIQVDGYIQDIEWDRVMKYLFIASDTTGGSSSTYIPDYQYSHDNGETNILLAGGDWTAASKAGLGYLYSNYVAANGYRNFGARAEYAP